MSTSQLPAAPTTDGRTTGAAASRLWAVTRAVLGFCVMAIALGGAGAIAQAVHSHTGLDGAARHALTAVVCCAVAVSLIVLLRRKLDRRPLSGLGLVHGWAAVRTFGLGVLVTAGSAAILFAAGTSAGWLEWTAPDLPRLAQFILVNAVLAFALEALPEELVFRGYVYDTLTQALRGWTAFVGTVLLFTFAGGASTVCYALVGAALGEDVPAPSFAPAGEDPVAYAILYPIFGAVLLIARITTSSLWTSVALHLTYLTVVRISIDGASRSAGWSAEPTTPDALLIVPGFLLLSALLLLALSRCRGRVRREHAAVRP